MQGRAKLMATPNPTPNIPPRPAPPALSYQHPSTRGRGTSTDVAAIMLKREANFQASWTALAIAGAVVSVLAAAIPATIIWLISFRFRRYDDPWAWSTVYGWTVIIGIPLAFALEHLTRGTMLADAAS